MKYTRGTDSDVGAREIIYKDGRPIVSRYNGYAEMEEIQELVNDANNGVDNTLYRQTESERKALEQMLRDLIEYREAFLKSECVVVNPGYETIFNKAKRLIGWKPKVNPLRADAAGKIHVNVMTSDSKLRMIGTINPDNTITPAPDATEIEKMLLAQHVKQYQ